MSDTSTARESIGHPPMLYRAMPPQTAQLVVIGAGVVGAATAFYAERAGLRPVVLEDRAAPCTFTTPASTGAFRLQFDNREELELVRESVALFLDFPEATGQRSYDLHIRQQGYLWATTSETRAEVQRALVERQHSWGQTDIELFDGEEARHMCPYLAPSVVSARFRAKDGFLDPKALTFGLLEGSGAEVVVNCPATGFRVRGDRLAGVETALGTLATDTAVIAAGPFAARLAASAGIDLPIEILTRHKLVIPEEPAVPAWAPMTIDDDTGTHWRPALGGAYLLYPDPSTTATDPVDDVPPDHRFATTILDPDSPVAAARISPFWRGVWERGDANWLMQSGQYDMTPDHRPLLDETGIRGLWVNNGYSGHGIMGSPAGSRHLIDLLTGRLNKQENPFRLDRPFGHRPTDLL